MASLQLMVVACLLYVEIGISLLLTIPFIKPWLWKKVFGLFRFLKPMKTFLNFMYIGTLGILILLFVDSIREMNKFSSAASEKFMQHEQELDRHMKMFRAQRNFYISGFAVFLFVVIRRLGILISRVATLEASNTALESQARNASQQLLRNMDPDNQEDKPSNKEKKAGKKEAPAGTVSTGPSKDEYDALKKELDSTRRDLAVMKKQSESLAAEYDRVSSEYQKLQQKCEEEEAKKDK